MSTIAPPYDPTSYLGAPAGHGAGDMIWRARMSCGPIIGGVDGFIDAISGFSPLEEWVMKPFAGDWDAFDKATQAWSQVGKATEAVARNLAALPTQVADDEWAGDAREAWAGAATKISQQIEPLCQACDAMSQYCSALGDLARSIIEFILETLRWAAETALAILAELAVPVAGEVVAAGHITIFGIRLVRVSQQVAEMLKRFQHVVSMIQMVVSTIEGAMANLARISAALEAADTASRAAVAATTSLE